MKKAINRPQLFFIFLAVVIFISGYTHHDGVIELIMYGTYIDLKTWNLCLFSTFYFVLIAANYTSLTITQKSPKRRLTIAHIILQVISLIPFVYYIYTANNPRTHEKISIMNTILITAFGLFIIASILHLINFVTSLLTKKD